MCENALYFASMAERDQSIPDHSHNKRKECEVSDHGQQKQVIHPPIAQWAENRGEEDISFPHLKININDQIGSIYTCNMRKNCIEYQVFIIYGTFKIVHHSHKISVLKYNNVDKK